MLQDQTVQHYADAIAQEALAAHHTPEVALSAIACEAVRLWTQLQESKCGGYYRCGALDKSGADLHAHSINEAIRNRQKLTYFPEISGKTVVYNCIYG